MSTFGYMCVLIIAKWNNDYSDDTSKAPSILNTMLNYGLKMGATGGSIIYGGAGE